MADELSLQVLLGTEAVGRLWIDEQQLQFEYSDAWRRSGFPLAPSVPLIAAAQADAQWRLAALAYFQNLLPEGQALEDVSRSLQISKASTFGLLRAMGGEAAGAVRVIDPKASAPEGKVRPIPHAELSARIRERQDIPFSVWDGTVRLSIAGYQDKLAVYEADDAWALVDGPDLASTHILKPDPVAPRLAGLTSNEFFCMRLAAAAGLSVAPVRLAHVPEPVLVVERFDRERVGEGVRRRHVVDGCQALGVVPNFKYERPYGDGPDVEHIRTGATLPQLFALGRSASVPAAFKLQLLRWSIFQALIQNFDAHAKNISCFWGSRGLALAPAYDLVSVGIYPPDWFPQRFAMAFGDAFAADELMAYEWAHMGSLCGIQPRQLETELSKLATAVERALPRIATQVIEEGADAGIVTRIVDRVRHTCETQQRAAREIRKIAKALFDGA